MSKLQARLAFFLATDELKELNRANCVYRSARLETVAEHSWQATLLAMLCADAAPPGVDHDRVRDLLTVHDLVEVFAGDTPLWDAQLCDSEDVRERKAGERLMALLPPDARARFDPLWREFQAQKSPEARFARAIDCLHPIIVSYTEGARGHPDYGLTAEQLLGWKRCTIADYPLLWELALEIVQGAVDRGQLPAGDVFQQHDPHHVGEGRRQTRSRRRSAFRRAPRANAGTRNPAATRSTA
jgi:putative hydrolase of HD superfamily